MESYKPSIGYAAGTLMVKWDDLDSHMNNQVIHIEPGDKVNVFINFECILRNITQRKNLATDLSYYKREICLELESAILNLVAHYRAYFKAKYKAIPKVYLYYTNLKSDVPQEMSAYNKYYRSYYHNRYIQNPQFKEMGNVLLNTIIPEVSLILSYIPNCYFIQSDGFDGSIIPQVISEFDDSKNVVISGDVFDTLYMYNPDIIMIYIKRRFQYFSMASSPEEVIRSIVKNNDPFNLTIFNSKMYFRLLLSIKGSKIRNIKSAKGFGYNRFIKILNDGFKDGVVLKEFSSLDSIIELFPEQYREDIKAAFKCTDLDVQRNLLNATDINNVKSQIIDKIDISSVEALNNKRFLEFPINLPYLLN